MRIPIPLGFVFAFTAALNAAPPNANDILAEARKALGGADKLATVKGLTAAGKYQRLPLFTPILSGPGGGAKQGPPAITGSREVSVLLPDNYVKSDAASNGPGITTIEGLGDGKGWNDTRMPPGVQGTVFQTPPGPNLDTERKQILARYLLIWTLSAPDAQFSYSGEAESPERKADVLDVKGPEDFSARVFIDQKTHLPLMLSFPGKVITGPPPISPSGVPDPSRTPTKTAEIQMHLSDYAKVSGVLLPRTIIWSADGRTTEQFDVDKYTINPAFKSDKFHK